jgi:hypothetical protein
VNFPVVSARQQAATVQHSGELGGDVGITSMSGCRLEQPEPFVAQPLLNVRRLTSLPWRSNRGVCSGAAGGSRFGQRRAAPPC